MARVRKFRSSTTRSHDYVCRSMAEAQAKGTMIRTAGRYEGRRVELGGRMLSSFGFCGYLGLERRKELLEASYAAAREYGTQFSISRVYLECPLYEKLEANLELMTGRPVLVAPSTTLAHMAALPVLVHDHDAVLIDQFAHASLHMATELLRDVPVHLVRHNRLDQVEELLKDLGPEHESIWLVLDGLYSMLGDFAPFSDLSCLLHRYPQLHLYVDDAHSTGWLGRHGRGEALEQLHMHDRVVVALSLNKSFAAAGGALALPDEALKMRLRRCGGPMLFSGPIQPPMLGVAVASSKIHLAADHPRLQEDLRQRIDYTRTRAAEAGLPLLANPGTPIFFLQCDSVDQATDGVRNLQQRGFYVCPSAFPAVPINKPGIRFTVSLHNEIEDIDALIGAAASLDLSSGHCRLGQETETLLA